MDAVRKMGFTSDDPLGDPVEILKSPHVSIQKRELLTSLVKPHKVSPRVHKAHHELPNLPPLATLLYGNLEEVNLGFLSWTVDKRDEDLSLLAAFVS